MAKFFQGLLSSKAHWYRIIPPRPEDPHCDLIRTTFPSLSDLLSLEDGLFNRLLVELGLAKYRRDTNVFSLFAKGWEMFISEFDLPIEFTVVTLGNRSRHYLLLGSWRADKHPKIIPAAIWKACLKEGEYNIPKLRISSISMRFTSEISELDLNLYGDDPSEMIDEVESSMSEEEDCDDSSKISGSQHQAYSSNEECIASAAVSNLSPTDFPLLSSLGIHTETHMDKLLQEVVKLSGRNKSVHYVQANNRSGWLVPQPSFRTKEIYSIELAKKDSFLDEILSNMMTSFGGIKEEEAAECLIRALHQRFEESFMSVALEKGVARNPEKKMDAASVEAMLSEARLNTKNSRMLFKHLNNFFGKSFFESEIKRRQYFAGQDYPPIVREKVLEDKTIITYWYKAPDELLKHQLKYMVTPHQLVELNRVDLTIGGDHGGGKFRMTLKILFRFQSNPTISRLFQIASVSHSKDEHSILCATVLDPIGESLQLVVEGGRFVVSNDLVLSFSPINDTKTICDVSTRVLIVGDLKYYAQLLGRENMSSYWCMWCNLHPQEWSKSGKNIPAVPWTIQSLKAHFDKVVLENLKEPRDISRVVMYPVWDFIEPSHYVVPILHIEIGLVNNVMDNFYDWVEDHVEAATPEEKMCRNKMILMDTELRKAQEKAQHLKGDILQQLSNLRHSLSEVKKRLKSRTILHDERMSLLLEEHQLEEKISTLVTQRKGLDSDVTLKRKKLVDAKAKFKEAQKKRRS